MVRTVLIIEVEFWMINLGTEGLKMIEKLRGGFGGGFRGFFL